MKKAAPKKRKPWIYVQPRTPSIKDAFAKGQDVKAVIKQHGVELLVDTFDIALHFGLKLLPSNVVSRIGAKIGPIILPRFFEVATKRAKSTIARVRPDLSKAEQHQLLLASQASKCRVMTEASIIHRMSMKSGYVVDNRFFSPRVIVPDGPLILAGLHLGNWEAAAHLMREHNLAPHIMYVPLKGRAKSWIASRIRRASGLNFLPPGLQGVKPALDVLESGGIISTFCDEGFQGVIRGPFFDQQPHLNGNMALLVKMARRTGATIFPWYNLRQKDFSFRYFHCEPIRFEKSKPTQEELLQDVIRFNAAIEPIIRANLDQWYFLDSRLAGPPAKRKAKETRSTTADPLP